MSLPKFQNCIVELQQKMKTNTLSTKYSFSVVILIRNPTSIESRDLACTEILADFRMLSQRGRYQFDISIRIFSNDFSHFRIREFYKEHFQNTKLLKFVIQILNRKFSTVFFRYILI